METFIALGNPWSHLLLSDYESYYLFPFEEKGLLEA